jgi:hypothetical protein
MFQQAVLAVGESPGDLSSPVGGTALVAELAMPSIPVIAGEYALSQTLLVL